VSPTSWATWVDAQLAEVRTAGQWRATRAFDAHGPAGHLSTPGGSTAGHRVVSFASNDYLGLSVHPSVVTAAHDAIDRWGTGATAWKHAERALVFSSGYAANVGVLAALGGPDVTVFSDELNHASIIDGCRLGRSRVVVYRHNDIEQLEELLSATPGRTLVVTDVVFSMDGDVARLDALAALCVRNAAMLVLDEAHSVLGPEVPLLDGLDVVRVGTLSKTFGSLGGWVVASRSIIELLVNRPRPTRRLVSLRSAWSRRPRVTSSSRASG
jgi:8-amino-7-oxononanoate synthase